MSWNFQRLDGRECNWGTCICSHGYKSWNEEVHGIFYKGDQERIRIHPSSWSDIGSPKKTAHTIVDEKFYQSRTCRTNSVMSFFFFFAAWRKSLEVKQKAAEAGSGSLLLIRDFVLGGGCDQASVCRPAHVHQRRWDLLVRLVQVPERLIDRTDSFVDFIPEIWSFARVFVFENTSHSCSTRQVQIFQRQDMTRWFFSVHFRECATLIVPQSTS